MEFSLPPMLALLSSLHSPTTQTLLMPTQLLIFQGPTILQSLARPYTAKFHHSCKLLTHFRFYK